MKAGILAAVIAASATGLFAGKETKIVIEPGPPNMSEAEKAIVADPAKDMQHGVILLEETERNDDIGNIYQTSYHLRAKILSNEARSLGDIAIPVRNGARELKKWWGRTICPDRTQELPESALALQMLEKSSSHKEQELRGALPGVSPGCVIDYGYVVESIYGFRSQRIFVQNAWPVRSMRFRWIPEASFAASYVLSRADGLAIKATADEKTVLITAQDLSPVPEEPHGPPLDQARASVTFYYTDSKESPEEYWDLEAKSAERWLKTFIIGDALRDVVRSLPVPKEASTEDRLRAAYDWIGQNLKNTSHTSAEEDEAKSDDDEKTSYNAKSVLKAKEGTPRQLDYVFAGMARALGVEANLVFAVDRTDHFWVKPFMSMDQFDYTVVAVRVPGQTEAAPVFVDAGSGLPYGEVPWRATGASALMCGPKGGTTILIPASAPKSNRTDTHATLAFSEENETLVAKWESSAVGAYGSDRSRWLRRLDPRERKETLDRLCGASGTNEVSAAELPGLENKSGPYKIACALEESDINIHEGIGTYSYRLLGPWWPETPEFTAATRSLPVLFEYPKVDVLAIDITAPHGFKPKPPATPVQLDSPYGRYVLEVTATPTGFHVDRAFALTALIAKKDDYPAVRKFFEDVRNADRAAVAFERVRHEP